MSILKIIALSNFESKINKINFIYAAKLGFEVQKPYVNAQKIDSFSLTIYGIVIAAF